MNKKVFRIWKYIEETFKLNDSTMSHIAIKNLKNKDSWIYDCDGKTEKECSKLGYKIADKWLVKEDE